MYEHLEFPYHTFVHCKGFAPAAPRRARVSISVPFSGLPLSRPLRIEDLVGLYPTNNLIRRQLNHRLEFQKYTIPGKISYQVLASGFRGYP